MIVQKTKYVSIPCGLATVVVESNLLLKTYSVFYQLKSLYVGGIILDYHKKVDEIAKTFGYSERKLRTYIKSLKEIGIVEVVRKRHLVLRASKHVGKLFGVSCKRFWRVKTESVSDLEDLFRVLAIEENIKQQRFSLEEKVVASAISTRVGIPNPIKTLQPSRLRILRKAVAKDYGSLLLERQTRYTETIASLNSPAPTEETIFPWATLSRQGIATVLNRKSKSTGHKYAKKFAALGYIQDERNTVFIGDFSYDEYNEMQETVLGYDYSYEYVKGEVHKVLPNIITMTNNFLY